MYAPRLEVKEKEKVGIRNSISASEIRIDMSIRRSRAD